MRGKQKGLLWGNGRLQRGSAPGCVHGDGAEVKVVVVDGGEDGRVLNQKVLDVGSV